MTDPASAPLLEVRNLVKHFPLQDPGLFGRSTGPERVSRGHPNNAPNASSMSLWVQVLLQRETVHTV